MLEIDNRILQIRNKLSPLPRADPRRTAYLADLAAARYDLTDENEDLEESISPSVEAILSFDPQIGRGSDVVTAFFFLAESLARRSDKLKRPDDSRCCVRYFRYIRDQSLETSYITRSDITRAFVRALAIQVAIGPIDPTRNIEEMASLFQELLRLDVSDEFLRLAAGTLVWVIKDQPFSEYRPPPDRAIECLREANIRFPDLDLVSLRLLSSLYQRFMMVESSHADYKDAMSIVDGSFTNPTSVKATSYLAVRLAQMRFLVYGDPEYLEEAIFRIRAYLRMLSSEDPERQRMNQLLENLDKKRFGEVFVTGYSQAADAGNTEINNQPSPSHVVQLSPLPITGSDTGELAPMTLDVEDPHHDFLETLDRLFDQPINRATIGEAMECHQRYLASSQSNDFLTPAINFRLAQRLIPAFRLTDDMAYLNEAITLLRDILKGPVTPSTRLNITDYLVSALIYRYLRFRETVFFFLFFFF